MTEPILLRELTDGVLLLTLNRPERKNSWTLELEETYFQALVDAAGNPDVRVIVITGSGTSFCPGLDMQVLSAASEGDHFAIRPRRPMTLAYTVPKPIIAVINGACAGIGLIQALCADIRFAAKGAKITTSFARRGLPAENASSWLLPRIVGTGVAMDLLLSARVITAEEAHELGLVNRVYDFPDLLPAALAYAHDVAANCSPLSMANIKRQVQGDLDRTCEQSRQEASRLLVEMGEQPDFREGVASYTEKRPPRFGGVAYDADLPADWSR